MRFSLYTYLASAALVLAASAPVLAQQKVFYQGGGNKLYTQAHVDSAVAQMKQRYQAQNLEAKLIVTSKTQRHDTLFCRYTISIGPASLLAAEAQRQRFVGQPLPPFKLRDLHGQTVSSEKLRGRPLVLNLWFTTCGGCIQEMPALNQAQAAAANKGIEFLALTYEPADKVRSFLRKRAFTFRHLPAARAYCDLFTQVYPVTIFVDKQGIIQAVQGGLPAIGPAMQSDYRVLAADGKSYLDATELEKGLALIR
jgi:peroxiredoxin